LLYRPISLYRPLNNKDYNFSHTLLTYLLRRHQDLSLNKTNAGSISPGFFAEVPVNKIPFCFATCIVGFADICLTSMLTPQFYCISRRWRENNRLLCKYRQEFSCIYLQSGIRFVQFFLI